MGNQLGNQLGNDMGNDMGNDFKNELADLLDKYGYDSIGLDYDDGSDLHGVTGTQVAVFDWHGVNQLTLGHDIYVTGKELRRD